jgi:lysyl-tRNA synthetase class II
MLQAYADYGDLMEMTEELLQKVCTELHGDASFDSAVATNQVGSPTRISFEGPFKRYDFIKTIEERSGCEMPPADKLETPEAIAQMAAILQGAGIDTSKLQNAPQVLPTNHRNLVPNVNSSTLAPPTNSDISERLHPHLFDFFCPSHNTARHRILRSWKALPLMPQHVHNMCDCSQH